MFKSSVAIALYCISKTSAHTSSTTTLEAPTANPWQDKYCKIVSDNSGSYCKTWLHPAICEYSGKPCGEKIVRDFFDDLEEQHEHHEHHHHHRRDSEGSSDSDEDERRGLGGRKNSDNSDDEEKTITFEDIIEAIIEEEEREEHHHHHEEKEHKKHHHHEEEHKKHHHHEEEEHHKKKTTTSTTTLEAPTAQPICDKYCKKVTGLVGSYCKAWLSPPTCEGSTKTCYPHECRPKPKSTTSTTTLEAPTASPIRDKYCKIVSDHKDSYCKTWLSPPVCEFSGKPCELKAVKKFFEEEESESDKSSSSDEDEEWSDDEERFYH